MAVKEKVRVRLKAYDHNLIDQACEKIIATAKRNGAEVAGPIPLPTKKEIVTILRAVHKYKDSREQFEMRTHKRLIDILKPSQKAMEALTNLELPAGVEIELLSVRKSRKNRREHARLDFCSHIEFGLCGCKFCALVVKYDAVHYDQRHQHHTVLRRIAEFPECEGIIYERQKYKRQGSRFLIARAAAPDYQYGCNGRCHDKVYILKCRCTRILIFSGWSDNECDRIENIGQYHKSFKYK